MEFTAKYRYAKMAPRKVQEVVDLIRGKHIDDALLILRNTNKRASSMVDKVLRSAISNADESLEAEMENLFVKEARVNKGPTQRRWRPRARGRATPERHRTSHINIVLDDGT
ncbi:MAG: 50S ribosomal protein L22 [Candidatus Brocadiia bacterium]|nr:50S ribosomal protein L22 [Planctomycetota bacterium]